MCCRQISLQKFKAPVKRPFPDSTENSPDDSRKCLSRELRTALSAGLNTREARIPARRGRLCSLTLKSSQPECPLGKGWQAMIVDQLARIEPGTVIPKPRAKGEFVVKGWGSRRGERALIYKIPNNKNPDRPYEKGVTVSELKQAYEKVVNSGEFSSRWFKENMTECSKEGSCNFTTIGGIFELLGIAVYDCGTYVRTPHGRLPSTLGSTPAQR